MVRTAPAAAVAGLRVPGRGVMARVWAESVGCKVSLADAEELQAGLLAGGHLAAASVEDAEVAVVTTCCVTAEAERSSRQRVRRLLARGVPVVVTGCAAGYRAEQFVSDRPAAERIVVSPRRGVPAAVVALLGKTPAGGAPAAVSAALAGDSPVSVSAPTALSSTPPDRSRGTRRTRAVLKVQDGCAASCTYCAVRLVRGAPWSLPLPEALEAARMALGAGCGELVVSGIDLGLYAGDGRASASGGSTNPAGLADLVTALAELPGLQRLRLSSIEPLHVDGPLLTAVAHPKVARHLHIPLQSADDGVLADMGRLYTFAQYREVLDAVRAAIPGVMVSTDVIAGFPTESAAAFERTRAAIAASSGLFGRVHVFTYSPRPGTAAARLTPLPAVELRRRRAAALAAAASSQEAAAERLVGRTVEVLLEDRRGGTWRGYSSEYARCRVMGAGSRGTLSLARAVRREGAELRCEKL
jgi:threonylcarbamoyladenosine tRNA methylthiotransferase MtaB